MNYYERHIGDYLKDTSHLSLLHHGIYARLLDVYYTREHGFAEGEAQRLVGARAKDERTACDEILAEFFDCVDGTWQHKRCEAEIARYRDKQNKAKASANSRWSHTERGPNAMRTHSEGNALQSPDTIPTTEAELPTVVSPKARPTKRCPASFLVTSELQQWARENASLVELRSETATFRDYEFGKACTDWPARWRVWMTKEQKRLAERAGHGESAKDRAARERAEEISTLSARKRPGAPTQPQPVTETYAQLNND